MNFLRQPAQALVIAAIFLPTAAPAADRIPEPTVEYSAKTRFVIGAHNMTGKVFYAPGMERREIVQTGQNFIMITRTDRNETYMLMPQQKMAMKRPMDRMAGAEGEPDFREGSVKMTKLGAEQVNGESTTKYKVEKDDKTGGRFEGFMWMTKDNIVVRYEGSAESGGQRSSATMELVDLERGKQDRKLFEIPAGYNVMPMQ